MTTMPEAPTTGYRISLVDEDPLRARREARELLAEIAAVDPGAAALDVPAERVAGGTDKGSLSLELVGVVISGGAFVVACVQLWLTRVPQRTIVVQRLDGVVLRISGREAREDDELIDRFLAGDGTTSDGTPCNSPAAG